jgi:hypothetical protein
MFLVVEEISQRRDRPKRPKAAQPRDAPFVERTMLG